MFRLVEAGQVDPSATSRSACAATGPASASSAWQADRGITSFFMHDVRRATGSRRSSSRTLAIVGDGPVFLTVDVDVLDPAFAPGTGHAGARRDDDRPTCSGPAATVAAELELVGAEVVEVIPTAVGSADVTALVADRIVREILNGIALRRQAGG